MGEYLQSTLELFCGGKKSHKITNKDDARVVFDKVVGLDIGGIPRNYRTELERFCEEEIGKVKEQSNCNKQLQDKAIAYLMACRGKAKSCLNLDEHYIATAFRHPAS